MINLKILKKEEMSLKDLLKFMQEKYSEKSKFNFFKTKNFFRNLDKQIFLSFVLLFLLGLFFSFSSTSFIADERLNKDYYFFFQKHLLYALLSFSIMFLISVLDTNFLNKTLFPIFFIFLISMFFDPFYWRRSKRCKKVVKSFTCLVFNQLNLSNHFLF